MSNSDRPSISASGRLLDEGSRSEKKEMGDEAGLVMSNSRDILRRYLHAGLDSDRRHTSLSGGIIDPQMGSVHHRPISPVQNFRFQHLTVDGSVPPPPGDS